MSETLPAQNLNVPENGPMTVPPPTMQTQPGNVGSNHFWRNIFYLVRDIKPPNHQSWFSQFFPRIFLSFSSWKRKQTFYWFKTGFLSHFWTNISIHQFTNPQFFFIKTFIYLLFFFWIQIIKPFLNLEGKSICILHNHENNHM